MQRRPRYTYLHCQSSRHMVISSHSQLTHTSHSHLVTNEQTASHGAVNEWPENYGHKQPGHCAVASTVMSNRASEVPHELFGRLCNFVLQKLTLTTGVLISQTASVVRVQFQSGCSVQTGWCMKWVQNCPEMRSLKCVHCLVSWRCRLVLLSVQWNLAAHIDIRWRWLL